MKKKTKEDLRKVIGDIFTDHLTTLKMDGYHLFVLFPEDEGWFYSNEGGFVVSVKYPYKDVHLAVPQDYIDNYEAKRNNIRSSLLHEAVHVMLWRYTELAERRFVDQRDLSEAEEYLVDHIAHVIESLEK